MPRSLLRFWEVEHQQINRMMGKDSVAVAGTYHLRSVEHDLGFGKTCLHGSCKILEISKTLEHLSKLSFLLP